MKNLFSERYGHKKIKQLQPDEIPDYLRKRIWNVIKDEFFDCPWIDRDKAIEVIWDEFFKEDKDNLKGVETYI